MNEFKGSFSNTTSFKGKMDITIIKEYPELEDLEITPSTEEQNFKSEKYGYNEIKVKPIESEEIILLPSTEGETKEGLFHKVIIPKEDNFIEENIKKGVTIWGKEGAYSPGVADLSSIGTTVTVEANSAIQNGERWVGVLNDAYTQANLGSQIVSNNGATKFSKDLSVGCKSYTISSSTTNIIIWLFNNETSSYDSINVDVSTVVSELENYLDYFIISDDGSLIMFNRYNNTPMFVEIDKETRTAKAYVCKYTYAVMGNPQLFFGNKYVAVPISGGTDFYEYNKETHSLCYLNRQEGLSMSSVSSGMPTVQVNSNTWIHLNNGLMWKFSLNNLTFSLLKGTAPSRSYLSADGQYLTECNTTCKLHKLNVQDLSYDVVLEHTYSSRMYWFLDGTTLIESTSSTTGTGIIYDISGGNFENWIKLATETAIVPYSTNYNWSRHKWMNANGTKIYGYPQGNEAQYLISSIKNTKMESGKVYGIASSSLNLGDIDTAQLLFTT